MLRQAVVVIATVQIASVAAQDFVFDEERNVLQALVDGSPADLALLGHKVESSCSFSDGGLYHVFLPDGDGGVHQYVTDLEQLLYVRVLHANPDTDVCVLSAAGDWLYYLDPATGIWRVPAGAETEAVAEPVSMFAPWGDLAAGVETIAASHVTTIAESASAELLPQVVAARETTPVRMAGDVADDPAIFVHPVDPSMSLVLGSDKAEGLRVYGLDGRERQFLPVGRLNNVDVRVIGAEVAVEARGQVRGETGGRAFAVASNRTHRRLDLFEIDIDTGFVAAAASWPVSLDDPYGVCVAKTGPFDVFVSGTEGHVQRWRIEIGAATFEAEMREEIVFDSQTEGCAVDAAAGVLYVGEEDVGVWRVPLAAAAERSLLIAASGDVLVPDVEGIAIVRSRDGDNWLVVSSQGDDSFVLYDLDDETVRLKFRVAMNFAAGIDGVAETDGLDVTTAPLPGFPEGVLVVQDGRNVAPAETQNFKLVSWGAVEAMLR